jgi:hypothetical protein
LTGIIGSILVIYSWITAALMTLSLYLIGRFYEMRYGQRSNYQFFLVPAILFLAAGVWDAFFANQHTGNAMLDFVGAWGPDLLWLAGGTVLIFLGYSLYRTMMGGQR